MKKNLLPIILLVTSFGYLSAQSTGIGTTKPDASARLDLSSNNQGILIPRISLTSTTVASPVTSPATSLMVYNTATINNVTPGYYYWDGTQWVRFQMAVAGAGGNTILNGTSAPVTTTGNVGDFYINTATNQIFGPKTTSGWGVGTSLVGPAGATGAAGAAGKSMLSGSGAPTAATGITGDTYVDNVTGFVYSKATGSWVSTGQSLKGPTGAAGATGPQGIQGIAGPTGPAGAAGAAGAAGKSMLSGSGAPTATTGITGDTYVDNVTGFVYSKATGSWVSTGQSLKGPTGATGPQGPSGATSEPWFAQATQAGATTNTENIYQLGNVGIGTNAPASKLDVNGQISGGFGAMATSGVLDWNDISNARSGNGLTLLHGNATNGPTGLIGYFHPFSFEYTSKNGSGNMTQLAIPYAGGSLDQGLHFRSRYSATWSPWQRIISENQAGNVGIGTYTPTAKLDVAGTARVQNLPAGATTDNLVVADASGNLKTIAQSTINNTTASNGITEVGNDIQLGGALTKVTTLTTTATNTLAIAGLQTGATTDEVVTADASGNLRKIALTTAVSSSEPWRVQGGTTPATLNTQHIYQTGNVMASSGALQSTFSTAEGGQLQLLNPSKTGANISNWTIFNMTGTYGNGLNFWRYAADATNVGPAVTFADNGNVGIGMNAPTEKLDINGNIQLSSGAKISSPGRLHIAGEETLYLLNKQGVRVSKSWSGNGNLAVEGQTTLLDVPTGTNTDNILVKGTDNIVKQISPSTISAAAEPWKIIGTTNPATDNTQNIYQTGNVVVGENASGSGVLSVVKSNAANNTRNELLGMQAGTDPVNGPTRLGLGVIHSTTATNRYAYISSGDNLGMRSLILNNNGSGAFGNVGIYTSSPLAKFHIGNGADNSISSILVTSAETPFRISTYQGATGANALVGELGMEYNSTKNSMIKFYRGGSTTGGSIAFSTNNDTEAMRITSNQSVGIGTATPTAKLDVAGTARVQSLPAGAATDNLVVADASGNLKTIAQSTINNTTASNGITEVGNDIQLGGALTKATTLTTTAANTLAIAGLQTGAATDNVLLTTTSGVVKSIPASTLIQGNNQNIYNTDGTLTGPRTVNMAGNNLMFTGGGNIGIATATPVAPLDVQNRFRFNWNAPIYGVGMSASETTGGWARGYNFTTSNGLTKLGGFGGLGGTETLDYLWIGKEHNDFVANFNLANKLSTFSGKVIISDTSGALDAANDKVLVVGTNGEVKNSGSTIATIASSTEPWFNTATNTAATSNTQNIYQSGNIESRGGRVISSINGDVGGSLYLNNPKKTGTEAVNWTLFNMTGVYTKGLHFWRYAADGTNLGSAMQISDTGNVGIGLSGSTAPTAKLDVAGTARVQSLPAGAATDNLVVADASGNLKTIAQSSINNTTASNGITEVGNDIQLGGALTKATTLTTTATNTLAIAGLQTGAATDNVLLTTTSGVVKSIPASTLIQGNNQNIYNTNGTLTGPRTVNMAGNTLHFANGPVLMTNNASALSLVGTDHQYIQFYPRGIANGRKGYLGFAAAGTNDITVGADTAGAKIKLANSTDVNGDLTVSGTSTLVNTPTGAATDNILVKGTDNIVKQISPTTISAAAEPWKIIGTTNPATDNTQNIYQTGNVVVGENASGSGVLSVVKSNAANNTRNELLGMQAGTDPVNGPTRLGLGVIHSTTAANRYAYIGSGDNITMRPLILNNNGSGAFGNVGINTTNPLAKFHIGNGADNSISSILVTSNETPFRISTYQGATGANALVGELGMEYNSTKNSMIKFYRGGSTTGGSIAFSTNNDTEAMRITSNQSVGIGTATPTAKLDVAGTARVQSLPTGAATDNLVVADASGNLKTIAQSTINNTTASNGITEVGNDIQLGGALTKATTLTTTATNTLAIAGLQTGAATDNVLLTTTSGVVKSIPASTLIQGNNENIYNTDGTLTGPRTVTQGANNLNFIGTGNIGIGTNAPASKLDVNGQISGGFGAMATSGVLDWNDISNARSGNGLTLLHGNATNGPTGLIGYFHPFSFEYTSKNGSGNMTQLAIPYAGGSLDQGLHFRSRYSATWSPWQRIISENQAGNVGIGTYTPTAKLDVAGTARVQSLPAGATTDNLVVADASGNLKTIAQSTINNTTASNGITEVGNDIQLGGALTKATTLTTTATNTLAIAGLQTGAATDNVLLTTTSGVVKSIPATTLMSSVEPWQVQGTTNPATTNAQNIFQTGSVAIGRNNATTKLDVEGDVTVRSRLVLSNANTSHMVFNHPASATSNPLYLGTGLNSDGSKNNIILYNLSCNTGCNFPQFTAYADNTLLDGTATISKRLNVNGDYTIIKGLGNEQAYLGGDGAGNDVQLGSMNPAIADVSVYGASGFMNLTAKNLTANGNLNISGTTTLGTVATGAATDNVLLRDAAGLVKQIPASTLIQGNNQNIYNSNGTVTSARTVNQNGNNITFQGGELINSNANGFRWTQGNFGMISRNDGAAFYLLPTLSGAPLGGWSTDRPFTYSFSNKNVLLAETSGNVGIGTAAPNAKLHVLGNSNVESNGGGFNLIGTNHIYTQYFPQGTAAGRKAYVGFAASGATDFSFGNEAGGKFLFLNNTQVNADLTVTGTIYQTSDAKFKKEVKDLQNGSSTISSLRPVTYKWNDEGVKRGGDANKEQIGFIAQEVEKVLPDAVQTDKEGNKSVNYIQVVPVLTKAVQELKSENEQLKKEQEELKSRLDKIEALLNTKK